MSTMSSRSLCSKCGALTENTYNVYLSPPSDMLNSNTVFSAAQTSRFSKMVSDIEADLSRLDGEMSQLQMAMDHLVTERQKLEMSLDEYRSLVAPIRRMPPEMLCEMFMHCLVDGSNSFDVTRAPLHLTFVCSKWRRVAISTPRLWSYISLDYAPSTMELLQTWLLRSGSSPLTLVFESEEDDDEEVIAGSSYFDTIIPHSHRWRDVTFALVDALFMLLEHRVAEIKDHLPVLERLDLDCLDIVDQPMTIFENAPMLHTVTLMDYSQYLLPWHQLKNYHARAFSTTECLQLLQQCTNLTHCTFERLYSDLGILNTSIVVHSKLQSMRLVDSDISELLDNIVLPALQVLAIRDSPNMIQPPRVSSFLDRSSCNLQHLTLRTYWTGPELIVFLQGLPSLVEVVIEEVTLEVVAEQVLRGMTYDASRSSLAGSHVLLPKLKRLSFLARLDFDHKVILDMVQSRRGHPILLHGNSSVDNQSRQVGTLEFISLDFMEEPEPEAIAQIASMQERGLEVQIVTCERRVL
ncbi:hypothetical protein PILCRDRAFT_817078 [Piloderma croceum F 1598]|uniref:Uncharacterized protein n=1 Tax=Piloderma croceum (strain F 1598) TaxID=765440 RepID=A0A0C3C818_PILCF|nr:hypothetical protein PILCRDRAFT_817078 [Piloderma croceum F 1598]